MAAMAPGVPEVWGATAEEVAAPYPCDDHLPAPDAVWFRAVTVDADPSTTFRWLCQLKVAPYSYDLLDNFGRRTHAPSLPAWNVSSGDSG